jgi:hypothetical protein
MLRRSRRRIASATALAALSATALALPAAALALPAPSLGHARRARLAPPAPYARAAHALRARDTAHLRYLSASGSLLHERGGASGTLPGQMIVYMRIGPRFSGSFTIYARGGSIQGRGSAIPKGEGVYESFAGSLTVTGGSGRYRRAHGRARLYGTFNRNTYALVVQTVGTLLY